MPYREKFCSEIEAVVEAAVNGILVADQSGKVVHFNQRFLEAWGLTREILGFNLQTLENVVSEKVRHPLRLKIFSTHMESSEIELKDGRVLEMVSMHFEQEGCGAGIVFSFIEKSQENNQIKQLKTDLKERNGAIAALERSKSELESEIDEATAKLREAERRSLIGEVATMVGHDLRNPLQVVLNRLYIAKNSASRCQDAARELETLIDSLEKQVNYMNKIVSNLLDCGCELYPEVSMVEFKSLVFNALSGVPEVGRYSVRVSAKEELRVPVDVELMSRALVNLANNAIQAMPEGGEIEFHAEEDEDGFLICVSDNGPGIAPENLRKIFTPFFTTKAKGMGLGLVVVKRIVEAHGGHVSVKSRPGEGTRFRIKIPARIKGLR
ncbi:MAG: ATP-binding protein [Candidatus Verstraetearchaeota archaeon]|nr:ATP-binding protein [Candidatus Verstraetearchaeota archaeon]